MSKQSIPRTIHYCWYGQKDLPPLYTRCIDSWQKVLKGYRFIIWNESNTKFDNPFLKEMLKNKQWAFISDYIRMRVIYDYGGIYLDADIEVIKTFDTLLGHECFLAGR
jgi:mannosyltransferase OCH1-like enzyme